MMNEYVVSRLAAQRAERIAARARGARVAHTARVDRRVDRSDEGGPSRGGDGVDILPLAPGDTEAVLAVFTGLSMRSRALRFLAPRQRLTSKELRALTAVDHDTHVALLAVSRHEGRPIGIGRFVREREDPEVAEVAVAVVDDWQGRGIGTRLSAALAQRAHDVGVRRFRLLMSVDNTAALGLVRAMGLEVVTSAADRGSVEYLVSVDPRSERSATTVPRRLRIGDRLLAAPAGGGRGFTVAG
jgi:GNAT superfamily N-acetyltransferase